MTQTPVPPMAAQPRTPVLRSGAPTFQGWKAGCLYGWMGFPLAFVALPLYVVLPNYYAVQLQVPLTALGALMLGARLFDAVIDPLLGHWSDALYARSLRHVLRWGAVAAMALALGFVLLFFPLADTPTGLLVWAGLALLLTYTAYSAVSILHQSWGARLGGDEAQRSRVVAWREGLGLAGVVLASLAPFALGMQATSVVFVSALATGWWAWSKALAPQSRDSDDSAHKRTALWQPFTRPSFRGLFAIFMVNGIASAIPATLILFFVQDRLQAPAHLQPYFLGSYFFCAALAMPLWLRLVPHLGLARTWAMGMLLAVAAFVFAAQLGVGDATAFMLVCALSGVALGTDLALPAAMLAGVIAAHGDQGRAEGAYFGWWNFATKLNLALAAGVSLPLLGLSGYTPGAQDAVALRSLSLAYCLVPCALKLLAATLLYFLFIRKPACHNAS